MLNFPGALFHQWLNYLNVYLNDRLIETVIIHIRIDGDLFVNSGGSGMDHFISNVKNIAEKFLMFGIKNVFVSGLAYTTEIDVSLLERVFNFP